MKNTSIQATTAEYKALDGQVSVDEAKGIVECFVAAIGNKDSVGDICLPGCFNGSLKRRKPRVVWGHNWNEPIGKVLEIYEVGPNDPRLPAKMRSGGVGGLFAKVQFNLKSERGREAFANVSFFGHEQEWSIGYKTLDAVYDPAQSANLLKEVELYEVSPVLHGANQLTGTISIKAAKQPLKDPKGGLTAAGRAHFKRTEGANLKPGVKGAADTPQKMRRKGSFLTRFFTNPRGPMKDAKGRPTRLALSAAAWGEPVPQDRSDAAKLAAKGRRLLERYENTKKKSEDSQIQTKNHIGDVYASSITLARPQDAARLALTEAVARHFGGPCRIMYADQNMIVAEMRRDGVNTTLRIPYHSQGDGYMFGTSEEVKPQVVYVPTDSSAPAHAFGWQGSPEKNEGGCGCDSCGKPMPSWNSFKEHNPGKHLFVHSADDIGLFAAINEAAGEKELDIELLDVGVAIKNIDSLDDASYEELIELIDDFEEKRLGATLRRVGRTMDRFDPDAIDADMDRIVQEGTPFERPSTRINRPDAARKPKPARMMPSVPQEEPKPEKVPEPVPERQPQKPRVPQPPIPAPQPVRPTPVRPSVPVGGLTGAIAPSKKAGPKRTTAILNAAKAGRKEWAQLLAGRGAKPGPEHLLDIMYYGPQLSDAKRKNDTTSIGRKVSINDLSPEKIYVRRASSGVSLDDLAKELSAKHNMTISAQQIRQLELEYMNSVRDFKKSWPDKKISAVKDPAKKSRLEDLRDRVKKVEKFIEDPFANRSMVFGFDPYRGKGPKTRPPMKGGSPREVFESRMAGESLEQAAERLGTTREKVRQMEQKYIAQLRKREELANKLGEALKELDSVALGIDKPAGEETQLDDDTAAMFWQTMAMLRGEWEPATMEKDGYEYSHDEAIAAMRETAAQLERNYYSWNNIAASLFRKAADLHQQVVAEGSYKKFRDTNYSSLVNNPIRNMPELDKFRSR